MSCHDYLYALSDPRVNSRRWFLKQCGLGLGKIALASLLTDAFVSKSAAANIAAADALKPRAPHFPGKAKRVIHLFMAGAPSHLDLFDYKPELEKLAGKPLPPSVIAGQRYAFIRPDAAVLGPQFKFAKYGQCGAEISEVMPHLAGIVDDICFIKSMKTEQFNHAPGQIFLNTGFARPGRPSLGSWCSMVWAAKRAICHLMWSCLLLGASAAVRRIGRAASCRRSMPEFAFAIKVIQSSM